MKRLAELVVFVALAAGVHLAFALQWSDGSEAGGVGGTEMLSIEAASASVGAMGAQWERAPEVAVDSPAPDAPTRATAPPPTAAPDLPVLRTAALALPSTPRAERPGRPDLSTPAAMVPPPVAAPQEMRAPEPPAAAIRPEARPAPRPEPAARPELKQAPPEAAPRVETETPAPPKPPEQKPKVAEKPPAPAKPAETARPSSAGQAAQRAAGSGGQAHAGSSGSAQVATLSKGQKARLASVWGAQVRARIERRKVRPRGRASGTVQLRLTVARDGRVLGVSVIKSSGVAAIDKAALSSVSRAGRMPKAPKGLDDPTYGFRVPIEFN